MSLAGVITRQLARKGRPMTLKRRVGTTSSYTEVSVQGYQTAFSPQDVAGLVQQGDARVTIGPSVGALTIPHENDTLMIDTKAWRVLGAQTLYAGATLAGWRLWVRGGAT